MSEQKDRSRKRAPKIVRLHSPDAQAAAGDTGAPTDGLRLMTEVETADYLGLTTRTLQAWRVKGGGPPFLRVSPRVIRYRRVEIDAWLEARRARSTSDYGQGGEP